MQSALAFAPRAASARRAGPCRGSAAGRAWRASQTLRAEVVDGARFLAGRDLAAEFALRAVPPCPIRIRLAGLTSCSSRPICPQHQTCPDPACTSQSANSNRSAHSAPTPHADGLARETSGVPGGLWGKAPSDLTSLGLVPRPENPVLCAGTNWRGRSQKSAPLPRHASRPTAYRLAPTQYAPRPAN